MIKTLLIIDDQEQTIHFDTRIGVDRELKTVSFLKAVTDAVFGEQQEAVLKEIISPEVLFWNTANEVSLWKNHQLRRW